MEKNMKPKHVLALLAMAMTISSLAKAETQADVCGQWSCIVHCGYFMHGGKNIDSIVSGSSTAPDVALAMRWARSKAEQKLGLIPPTGSEEGEGIACFGEIVVKE